MTTTVQKSVKSIPEGYTMVTPWIISKNSVRLIEFLTNAFGAEEKPNSRVYNEDGSIGHVEVQMKDAVVMLFDSKEGWPETSGYFRVYVEDAKKTFVKAIKAGASAVTELTPLFWGDIVGRVRDPFGNIWWIQERVQDITDQNEIEKRASDPQAISNMKYVEQTLDEELGNNDKRHNVKDPAVKQV